MSDRQDATDFTKAVNDELLSLLPFEDRQDFEDAARGHINDETLRLANHGFGPAEIAEQVKLPDVLDRHWALRGYYGRRTRSSSSATSRRLAPGATCI